MIHSHAREFLSKVFCEQEAEEKRSNVFVTLTYAQSLDGKIAGEGGKQILLSGEESMVMTHRMRTKHDGILVGIGTVLSDDPKLTARRLEPGEESTISQPRPIILDPKLKFPLNAKLLNKDESNENKSHRKTPWIFTQHKHDIKKKLLLEQAGAKILTIDSDENGYLSLSQLLTVLSRPPLSISRLMVEGGAKIIQSFFKSGLVDLLIVTIAPVYVVRGISVVDEENQGKGRIDSPSKDIKFIQREVHYEQFGRDVVMAVALTNGLIENAEGE
ncbi:2058_t:CDS:2 [Paraglomus brasilianum]|uniref:2,5-diamino-6-ribosylamino-4(3H)-pyrimidinone 5'-phosphate reductase n=1 Tax=Paraglomus brasilianum TaxID=144538 RepID=A0A9N9FLG1_9GLOM|nr:2058_t:CDS:2 [Paraglomus brasilianum]